VVVWSDAPGGSVKVSISGAPQVDEIFGGPQAVAPGVLAVVEANGPLYVTYRNQPRSDAGVGGAGPLPDGGTASGGAAAASGGASNAGASNGGSQSNGGASSNGGTSSGGAVTMGKGGTSADGGLAAGAQSGDDSGCGCRTAPLRRTWGWYGAAVIAALMRRARRRVR
jgi:hypothetical protein